MDGLVLKIVDLLRSSKENRALNAGGPAAGATPMSALLPRGVAPKHQGRTIDELADLAERG